MGNNGDAGNILEVAGLAANYMFNMHVCLQGALSAFDLDQLTISHTAKACTTGVAWAASHADAAVARTLQAAADMDTSNLGHQTQPETLLDRVKVLH